MKIFNILIIILSIIIIYIILKNYNNKKIEKYTTSCTASLTDWKKMTTQPSGQKLTDPKWIILKNKFIESNKDTVSFSFNSDLFTNTNFDYTIDINDYIEVDRNGSKEYWQPTKKWKEGVVSHFCNELCAIKLGLEWIKTDDITNLVELSLDIGEKKTNEIKTLIKSKLNNEYAILNETELENILVSSYINTNNYIEIDGVNYKVCVNMPIGIKWKVYSKASYNPSKKEILSDITNTIVNYFNNLNNVNIGDIIIFKKSDYNNIFGDFVLKENHVIHPNYGEKCFMPESFIYDNCKYSCSVFGDKEFDNYLKLINLRESLGYKTSSFVHTTDIVSNSDNNLLNLVNKLQDIVNNRNIRGNCNRSLLLAKLEEVLKKGEYVKHDNSNNEECDKTFDPHTYVKKPITGNSNSYVDLCNDLDNTQYRNKINPEIYKYITTEWINKEENSSYNLETSWNSIKNNIDLSQKDNEPLKNKIISKNQLSELIVKYLDDVENYNKKIYRIPFCYDGDCYGDGIIIKDPNTGELIDSKNNKLNETDVIELYTDKVNYHWEEVSQSSNALSIPIQTLGEQLSNGIITFSTENMSPDDINEWELKLQKDKIYSHNDKYYKFLGTSPIYIKMGKIDPEKYVEITNTNIDKVGKDTTNGNYITQTKCNNDMDEMINNNNLNRLNKITQFTDEYYTSLLNEKRNEINTLKNKINNKNTNFTSQYTNLCNKYNNYKLHTNYNKVKFIKDNSLNTDGKNNLIELAQKTIKLEKINTSVASYTSECKANECRNLGNITNSNTIEILKENTTGNTIIINLNDFSRIIDNKVNILEKNYIQIDNSELYKVLQIYDDDNIINKMNQKFSDENYPDELNYDYDDFISLNIDLHMIDINKIYYITVGTNDFNYQLVMDDTFKNFISQYKIIYSSITDIVLEDNEKCKNSQIFAEENAINKTENPCQQGYSCKDNQFTMNHNITDYNNILAINSNNKNTWDIMYKDINDGGSIKDAKNIYNDIYKEAVGYDISDKNNTHANYWRNKFNNDTLCPTSGGKESKVGNLYNVNPNYNYGLKWKKLPNGYDLSGKTIIQIKDYSEIISYLNSEEDIIDLTDSQNNIIFEDTSNNTIQMSNITNNHCLMITYIDDDDGTEFNNYYEVFGTNKCSSSQICSSKSNREYMNQFNEHVKNIYRDQQYCDKINTDWGDLYDTNIKTYFENDKSFKINNNSFKSWEYYPEYDETYKPYEYNETYNPIDETYIPE